MLLAMRSSLATVITAFILSKIKFLLLLLHGQVLQGCTVGFAEMRPWSTIIQSRHSRRYDHSKPLQNDLHWLRVPERITFKLCVLVYNCLHGTAPRYLQDVIQPVAEVTSHRRLRSASSSAIRVLPATRRSSLADRAFAVNCLTTCMEQFTPVRHWLLVTSHLQEISQNLLIQLIFFRVRLLSVQNALVVA